MTFRKFIDIFVLFIAIISFIGFFIVFIKIFSGDLEKDIAQRYNFTVSNISTSIEKFSVNAESAYFVELNSSLDQELYKKSQDKILPIASITKLVSAMIVIDNLDLSSKIKITQDIADWQEIRTINSEEEFFANDLLKLALIESNNSAIIALSQATKSQDSFVDLMNKKSQEIKLLNTKFFNETGLDIKGKESNYSTAQDLVILSKYILNKYPEIFQITTNKDFLLCNAQKENCRTVKNTNELLRSQDFKAQIIGSKTGETKLAGGCLLLLIKSKDNIDYISIILNSKNRFKDTEKIINKYLNVQ